VKLLQHAGALNVVAEASVASYVFLHDGRTGRQLGVPTDYLLDDSIAEQVHVLCEAVEFNREPAAALETGDDASTAGYYSAVSKARQVAQRFVESKPFEWGVMGVIVCSGVRCCAPSPGGRVGVIDLLAGVCDFSAGCAGNIPT
jgi:hypothetical protein